MSAVESPAVGVVTFAAADALVGAPDGQSPDARVDPRVEVSRQVEQAVQAAQGGANAARLEAELARARAAVEGIQASASGGGTVSITKDGSGNVVIRTGDGKTIVVGEGLVPPGAIEGLVASMAPPPPPTPFDQGPPDSVLALLGIIFGSLTLMIVGWPLARALGRRVEHRAAVPAFPADVAARLERIEQAVDAVAVEVERVSEAQRYSARLLTERLPESWPQIAGAQDVARPTSDRR